MDRTGVENGVADYERLWRTPGTELLAELFAPDAPYLRHPGLSPSTGSLEANRADQILGWHRRITDGTDEAAIPDTEVPPS